MKRLLIVLLSVLIAFPLVMGSILGVSYYVTGEDSVPAAKIQVLGQDVEKSGYQWHSPVFAGLIYKSFSSPPTLEAQQLGTLTDPQMKVAVPAGFVSKATLSKNEVPVWEGDAEKIQEYTFLTNGNYLLDVVCEAPSGGGKGYGTFNYRAAFTVSVKPRVEISSDVVAQGDVLAIRVFNLVGDTEATAETPLSLVKFTPDEEGQMTAFVPVTYNCEPDEYSVVVRAGDYNWSIPFTVKATEFSKQNLTIDTSDTAISEANSPKAYQEYRDRIYPYFGTADNTSYWSGSFVMPAQGTITTEYGLYRYTNGSKEASRHVGIDIGAEEDSPVVAPNNGRVVMADYLLNTGNTIVIEHGGGLKSYFFHMNSLHVKEGDLVSTGDLIGTVGTTGYSTGAHLHYEVRLFNQSINPTLLMNGKGNLFYFS